jgi:hypothetical protein
MNWGLIVCVFCFLFLLQIYIKKYPDERLSRIFDPKHGLRNQSRKELIEQIVFSFGASLASFLISFALMYLTTLFKLPLSLAAWIFAPFSLLAFVLFVFGAMCAVTIPFAKRKNGSQ